MMEFRTSSASETCALGEKIGACLVAGDVVLLTGDLGAARHAPGQRAAGEARVFPAATGAASRAASFTARSTIRTYCLPFHRLITKRVGDSWTISGRPVPSS